MSEAPPRRLAGPAAAVVALVAPFALDRYWLSTAVFVLVAAIGAAGLDVLTGRTGQISLGHAFFLGAGAYTAGVLGGRYHLDAEVWIPAAAAVAGLLGAAVAPATLRLRGLYLAIVTIGVVVIGGHVFVNVAWLSGGPGGEALPSPRFGPLDFATGARVGGLGFGRDRLFYYLALGILALSTAFVANLDRGSPGRAMASVRDREVAAAVMGVPVARTKLGAFVVSSALAGVSGALYGSYLGFVVPSQWDLTRSISFVVMIVVGGMASRWGPALGAAFVVGLPAVLRYVAGGLPFGVTGTGTHGAITVSDLAAVVFGVALVVTLLAEPGGLVGLARRLLHTADRG
ncbi:MAG: branched-chain amino acid ABC transporter permease [Acidimicrobiales bacterium]